MHEMPPVKTVSIHGPKDKTIEFAYHKPISFLLGPCAIESRQHALEMSSALKELSEQKGVSIVYKSSFDKANRTSNTSKRGVGITEGLDILAEVRETTGLGFSI